jgi:hypothetical protein
MRRYNILGYLFAILLAMIIMSSTERAQEQSSSSASSPEQAQAQPHGKLPRVLASVLPQLEAKVKVPILLPSELLSPIDDAEHSFVFKAEATGYHVSLYYSADMGDQSYAAGFFAEKGELPKGLGYDAEVELAHGISGFFRAIGCGGSCAPINLWWKQSSVVYHIQLMPPRLAPSKDPYPNPTDQEHLIVSVANSAILAGSR